MGCDISMEDKKILSFSIGPVQSFITQARKTKDSFSGSKLLSDIIHHVLSKFSEEQIIFPDKKIESKPNRFIVLLDRDIDENYIVEKVENIARTKYLDIAENTYKDIFGDDIMPIGFNEQIKDFLDINWVVLDYDERNYKEMYNELDSLMGSIKNTRIYKQIKYTQFELGEKGKKCNICGERNALFYKKRPPKSLQPLQYKIVKDDFISENESLCAICFTKRYYEREAKDGIFPSTADISLMNVINKLGEKIFNSPTLKDKGKFTADLLFEENINMEYIKENGMLNGTLTKNEEEKLIKELKAEEKRVKNEIKAEDLKLSKYYGIISFDGDSMGKWLSGGRIDGTEKNLLNFHRELSSLLGEFSDKARNTIIAPKGRIIYAGGEDFLGFINLENLFIVMKDLRQLFDITVNQPLKKYYKNEQDNLTFSAGVCITHYKTTLSNSIIWAKKMEEKAKDIDDKNAFAIAVLKRSGEIKMTSFKWRGDEETDYTIIELAKGIIDALRKGYFSDSFIYALGETIQKLPDECKSQKDINKEVLDNMIKYEIKRLLKRSADNSKLGSNADDRIEKMVNSLIHIYNKSNIHKDNIKNNFIDFLYILTFIEGEVYCENRN